MVQGIGFLPPTWEIWIAFLDSGSDLGPAPAVEGIWGMSQQMGERTHTRSLSLSLSPLFCYLYSAELQ